MMTLCVVTCGSRKIWDFDPNAGPTMAGEAYIGSFSRKCQEYAHRFYPNRWCILSAKYGFLGPREIVPEPYNVTFNDPKSGPITASALTQQAIERGLGVFDEVVVLGGKNYVEMIEQVFSDKLVKAPLRGAKGIGYMMGMMNEAIAAGVPIITATKGEDVIEITKKPKLAADTASRRADGGSLADRIRRYVFQSRIDRAREEGVLEVRIKAGDIHREMGLKNRMPAVCGALDAKKFLHYARVKLVERSGPKYGSTATWVFNCGRVKRC